MKSFKFMGEYKDDNSLPTRVQEGAVQFKEPDINKFQLSPMELHVEYA